MEILREAVKARSLALSSHGKGSELFSCCNFAEKSCRDLLSVRAMVMSLPMEQTKSAAHRFALAMEHSYSEVLAPDEWCKIMNSYNKTIKANFPESFNTKSFICKFKRGAPRPHQNQQSEATDPASPCYVPPIHPPCLPFVDSGTKAAGPSSLEDEPSYIQPLSLSSFPFRGAVGVGQCTEEVPQYLTLSIVV